MKPYQYYIDDILEAVYSPETADPDFLRDSAAMYAEACAEINDRLRNVARLLHRGLRSEAIQLAEQEPNLLDTFSLLDFSELPTWRQMLVNWGMAEPPELLIEFASELNTAYAEHQPIESLLRRHRLLALARAPLSARIAQLRQLVAKDANKDAWQNDLEIMEAARIKQIDGELQAAIRQGNLAQLTALYEETKNGDWSIPLPSGIVQKVETQYRQAAAVAARKDLERLDQELNQAHMAFDVDRARQVRDQWARILPIAMLASDDPLIIQTQPAFDWLVEADQLDEKQRQFEATVAKLETAMEDSADVDTLRRQFNTAQSFDQEIPEVLRHRVEQRLAAHDLAIGRKRRLVLGSIVGVLLLIAVGLTYWMIEQGRAKAVANAASTMEQLIAKEDYDNATEYYDHLAERLALSPAVLAQKSDLDSRVATEAQRQSDFRASLEKSQASPRDKPDRVALATAKKLAKTPAEQEQIALLEAEIAAASRQQQKLQNDRLLAELETLRTKLQKVENLQGTDQQKLSALKSLQNEILETKQKYLQASGNAIGQLSPLRTRIETLIESASARIRQAEWLEQLTGAVGDPNAYWDVLGRFAGEFPDSNIAGNLQTLNQEHKLLEGLLAWSTFLQNSFRGKKYFTPDKAQEIFTEGVDLQAIHPDLPFSEYLDERKPYLESIVARQSAGVSQLDQVVRLCRDPLIANLYMVKRKSNGETFYSRSEPVLRDNGANLEVDFIASFSLSTKKRKIPINDVAYQGRAPQSVLAEEVQEILKQVPERGWEESFSRVLTATADPSRQLDPILRMILLQRILEAATTGSSPLAEGFANYRKTLEDANVDLSVPWMAPDDDLATAERNRAHVLLSSMPPIDTAIRETAKRFKELVSDPHADFSWVGWLVQGADGRWTCQTKNGFPADGTLMIIHAQPGSKQAAIADIGNVENGQVVGGMILAPSQKVYGRPVFLRANGSTGN